MTKAIYFQSLKRGFVVSEYGLELTIGSQRKEIPFDYLSQAYVLKDDRRFRKDGKPSGYGNLSEGFLAFIAIASILGGIVSLIAACGMAFDRTYHADVSKQFITGVSCIILGIFFGYLSNNVKRVFYQLHCVTHSGQVLYLGDFNEDEALQLADLINRKIQDTPASL